MSTVKTFVDNYKNSHCFNSRPSVIESHILRKSFDEWLETKLCSDNPNPSEEWTITIRPAPRKDSWSYWIECKPEHITYLMLK